MTTCYCLSCFSFFSSSPQAAEVERLEREKETIAQLKVEEVEKERRAAEEREKERERLKKEADVKKKVEEMQRKRMEKRNATTLPKSSPEPSLAGKGFIRFWINIFP